MANAVTGGGSGQAWDLLTETAYDRDVRYYLRDTPQWRQLIDVRPMRQAMPGDIVVLSLHNKLTNATTPLSELVDPDAVAMPAPTRVPVTINEYGNAALSTLRLQKLAFIAPDPGITELLARNQADSVDDIIRAFADASTKIIYLNGGTMTTDASASPGTVNGVTATDIMARKPAVFAGTRLRRAKVSPKAGNMMLGVIHPDVSFDLQAEVGATAWNAPHNTGTDTEALYTGVTGRFMGTQWVETTRVGIATNSVPTSVYNTYVFGQEALVEVPVVEPGTVIGPQTDKLKRFFPVGWYAMFGHALFRPEAMTIVKTASSISAT